MRILILALASTCLAGEVSNEAVTLTAKIHTDKASVRQVLGADPGEGIVIVEIKVAPKGGKSLVVSRDDFTLRSDKDGQRSQPFAPSQIAGSAVLVVSTTGSGRGMMVGESQGPVWGGGPGTGERPRRLGTDGGSIGNIAEGETKASVQTGDREKPNPLLAVLKEKILEEKEIKEPLSGLLYFPLEGKHKPKDLELLYRGPAGKLSMRFRP